MTAHDSVYIRQGRGIENKKRIVAFYKIVPVLHQSVFNGLKVRCCCGAIINDHYYFFVAAHRVTGDKRGLYAGSECSSRFLALSGEEPLPLFDLAGKSGSKWLNSFAPLNRELYIAINLLVSSWGGWLNPAARPVRYLSWLKNHPVLEVPGDIVDGVALLLRKDREGRTLLKIIEELREKNPGLPRYELNALERVFNQLFPSEYLIHGKNKTRDGYARGEPFFRGDKDETNCSISRNK